MEEGAKPEQGNANAAGAEAGQGKHRRGLITAAVALGAAVLQPELLPGIAVGMAAMAAPNVLPRIISRCRPLMQAVRRNAETAMNKGGQLARQAKEKIGHGAGRVDGSRESQQPA